MRSQLRQEKNTTNRKYTESEVHELSKFGAMTSLYSIPMNQSHFLNLENTIML